MFVQTGIPGRKYVALAEQKWGERVYKVGEEIPGDDPHANYAMLVKARRIADVSGQVSMAQLERLLERIDGLEGLLRRILQATGGEKRAEEPPEEEEEVVDGVEPPANPAPAPEDEPAQTPVAPGADEAGADFLDDGDLVGEPVQTAIPKRGPGRPRKVQ